MVPQESPHDSQSLRRRVAREAAFLIYTSQEKEYKQAKIRAAEILGARALPSNREVAEELDAIAEELEGQSRLKRLLKMRREALDIMECLAAYSPRLIGSVWRGTVHRNSDIDIVVYSSNPEEVMEELRKKGFRVSQVEEAIVTKRGRKESSLHISVSLPSSDEAEVIIREPDEEACMERCEIYGDVVRGLDIDQLRAILKNDPYRRFIPNRVHRDVHPVGAPR
ncbi:MAG: DNA polymerase beta family nucleotidyltransferase [Candidatus Bathyarchaeota archaeon B63]|nr:MAG: DNA polymerase beta family nucleotidyltransferase [Candidatus Bathyarchaeota archaeon B63]